MTFTSETTNILFADIKNFSQLGTVDAEAFHTHVLTPLAGRLAEYDLHDKNTWGDAFVVSSGDIRQIAAAALDLRDFFQSRDYSAAKLPQLNIRISLHQGRIIRGDNPFTENGWIFGATVNRAARIEPVTEPGQVWTTVEIAQALAREEKCPFVAERLGHVDLPKNAGTETIYILKRRHEAGGPVDPPDGPAPDHGGADGSVPPPPSGALPRRGTAPRIVIGGGAAVAAAVILAKVFLGGDTISAEDCSVAFQGNNNSVTTGNNDC